MHELSRERILFHGPCLNQLSDLLCFDRIAYPTVQANKRPYFSSEFNFGYPADEPFPDKVKEHLTQVGLLVLPAQLFLEEDLNNQETMTVKAAEVGAVMAEIMFPCILNVPATANEEITWLRDIDTKTRKLADFAVKCGKQAVSKFYADDVTKSLVPGWTPVLSVMFTLPSVDLDFAGLKNLASFVSNEVTIQHRHILFDSIKKIEVMAKNGVLSIREIPDYLITLLAEYNSWILQSGISSGTTLVEFLLFFEQDFIEKLVEVELTKEAKKILKLRTRWLSLIEEYTTISGRELAYITHSPRHYSYNNSSMPPWLKIEREVQ